VHASSFYCFYCNYTSLFARKAAETSEKAPDTQQHKNTKKHCQSGRTSEQCTSLILIRSSCRSTLFSAYVCLLFSQYYFTDA